jgi:hypothetical protein
MIDVLIAWALLVGALYAVFAIAEAALLAAFRRLRWLP